MTLGFAPHQARSYTVNTPVYEGPLDLLLQLIERAELDITKLALAQVTDQYLVHIRSMEENAPAEVSAFLVIASRLLQIKSEMLLPRPPEREAGEEDPGDVLARQLIIYKRFKEMASYLAQREADGFRSYLRLAQAIKPESAIIDISGVTLSDLLAAVQSVFVIDKRPALATVVAAPRITIREKIGLIAQFLHKNQTGTFRQLLQRMPVRLDIVVTFLALLELVKRRLVETRQEQLFGDIEFQASETWSDNPIAELDFGE